jgi:hypothetical protein
MSKCKVADKPPFIHFIFDNESKNISMKKLFFILPIFLFSLLSCEVEGDLTRDAVVKHTTSENTPPVKRKVILYQHQN